MQVLLTESDLREGVARLAEEIGVFYGPRPLTAVAVLTGSLVFTADLIRRLSMPLRVGLAQASSYRDGATRPGTLRINAELLPDVRGRDVLLVDDIFDTGRTLQELVSMLTARQAASVR